MIKPVELDTADGRDTWDTIVAASEGDIATLRRLLERNPSLARAEYWYAPAAHFAAREGHAEAVQLLLDTGADPERNGLNDRTLIQMARERGHEQIARMLERARDESSPSGPIIRFTSQPIAATSGPSARCSMPTRASSISRTDSAARRFTGRSSAGLEADREAS
jgi:hypothetical protein